jgi:hypothetical protein
MIVVDRRWARMEAQFRAAQVMGLLIAQGLLEPRECLDALQAAASQTARDASPSGRGMVIAHALQDAMRESGRARARTSREMRFVLEPLLAGRAPSAALLDAATQANAEAGDVLLRHEVVGRVRECIRFHLAAREREAREARPQQRARA